ncbi:MAG: ABC transporter ATP-binding protein [Actinomycetota bacterium]|nr:ABC transporter ATP-binding protein [Actinomycetota bacterium]
MSSRSSLASSATPAPLLDVEGLGIRHVTRRGHRLLVHDVSFTVGEGETIGIVGESGSGKSMSALAVLGLLPKDVVADGSVRFRGRELIGLRERAYERVRGRSISLLLQDPFTMLNPLHRCIAHVEEGLARHGGERMRSRAARRAEALRRLAEVGIDERAAHRYPFEVSGGMAQRVGLASALAGDPEMLIADEPSTALDVTTQREILELLKTLRERRGMSLVLITHDLRVAFDVCDRIYVLYAGSVLEDAAPRDLTSEPLHPYTLGLLLSEPSLTARRDRLNVIPGSVPQAGDVSDRCPFAERCAWRRDACVRGHTPLVEIAPGRSSACIRIPEIKGELRAAVRAVRVDASIVHEPERPRPLLEVSKLVKAFPHARGEEHVVLQGVSLTVGHGEAVGLVGESGSGKTTLSRCVLGLETVTSGSIDLDGLDISDYERLTDRDRIRARRIVQVVFQNPYASLNPARTVGSTLLEAIRVAAYDGRGASHVGELLERVGLPAAYASRRPAALSGGERQRVAIARALAVRPKLLICDEPASALDVSVQAQILNLLRDLQRERGLALLFITHDLAVVRQVADYLYVISNGRFVEQGATPDVLDSPAHDYTRLLLASVAEGPRLEAVQLG